MSSTNPLASTDVPAANTPAREHTSAAPLACDGVPSADGSLADALELCLDRWMVEHKSSEHCADEESCCRSALAYALARPRLRNLLVSALLTAEVSPHDEFRCDLPQTVRLDDATIRTIEAMRTATINEPDFSDITLEFEYQR